MADHDEVILNHLNTLDYTDPHVAKAYTLFPYNQAIRKLDNNIKMAQFVSEMFADVIVALATQTTAENKTAQFVDATAWVPKQMRLNFKMIREYMREYIKTPNWVAEIKTQRAKEASDLAELGGSQAMAAAFQRIGFRGKPALDQNQRKSEVRVFVVVVVVVCGSSPGC